MSFQFIHTECSQDFFSWLHSHLLPCPFKWLTGIDCPGCGFQRSLLALFQGDLKTSLHLYPATIPLLIIFIYAILREKFRFDRRGLIFKTQFVLCALIITVSYAHKMGIPFPGV